MTPAPQPVASSCGFFYFVNQKIKYKMVTIYQVLTEKGTVFTSKDLMILGGTVATHFKSEWAFNNFPGGEIPDTGFVVEEQPGGVFVTNGFPDNYRPEIERIVDAHFSKRAKKRPRIPAKNTKVTSSSKFKQ